MSNNNPKQIIIIITILRTYWIGFCGLTGFKTLFASLFAPFHTDVLLSFFLSINFFVFVLVWIVVKNMFACIALVSDQMAYVREVAFVKSLHTNSWCNCLLMCCRATHIWAQTTFAKFPLHYCENVVVLVVSIRAVYWFWAEMKLIFLCIVLIWACMCVCV